MALDATQKEKLAALLAQEHVAVLVTSGDRWPTGNMRAFAETPELEILFIMAGNAEKFQSLTKHAEPTDWWRRATSARSRLLISLAYGFKGSRVRFRRLARMGEARGDFPEEQSFEAPLF
jgi:hypothetical protein